MRFLASLLFVAAAAYGLEFPSFGVLSPDPGSWPEVLSAIGLVSGPSITAHVIIAPARTPVSAEWAARVDRGALLVLEGESPLAESFGFIPGHDRVRVSSLIDEHAPEVLIVWEHELQLPVVQVPGRADVFARERWSGAPMLAGMRLGKGAVLWVSASPGKGGYERFPYLLAALHDLGLEPPFRSQRLWAFFDSSYRSRVDLDYFAVRWRQAGIAALQVAAWHFFDPDAERDAYLERLIAACHREGILVYAWLELPHVSDAFWDAHPEWREKTALGQDAKLDWRKLMNLANRECHQVVAAGVGRLIARFDWDGVNLAELYFESLEGIDNPGRFTPMNPDVRREFQHLAGVDPLDLFHPGDHGAARRRFLEYRRDLAQRIAREWIEELERMRRQKPDLAIVLTQVDDRFDSEMRDALGADAARVLPLLESHRMTFLIEDPATVWNLGPRRYRTVAERYAALTPHRDRLAIDLNIVERYQSVYPTKQQTGIELLELVHCAAASFSRTALYFENSLAPPDLPLLPAAAATVTHVERNEANWVVETAEDVGVVWHGPALVDGRSWPASDGETIWLPAGRHTIQAGPATASPHLMRLNGSLESIHGLGRNGLEFAYRSDSRAIAILDRAPTAVLIDGAAVKLRLCGPAVLLLPSGRHVVTLTTE
jgi:hypothetical protein